MPLINNPRDRDGVRDYLGTKLQAARSKALSTKDFNEFQRAEARTDVLLEIYGALLGELPTRPGAEPAD